jgi:putative transposase
MAHYLKHHGFGCNRKRTRRVYCELGLNLPVKPKKSLPKRETQPLNQQARANQSWSFDVISDSLATGQAFHTSNILDHFNRAIPWIEI